MPNINDLRRYAVAEPGTDDSVLELCMAAAERYFEGAGVRRPRADDPLYDLGIYMLAVHYFDNRGAIGDTTAQLPFGISGIIRQLSL